MKVKFKTLVSAAVMLTVSTIASAQNLTSVGAAKDWTVFQDSANSKHCYVVSTPASSKAIRDDQEVSVNRGDIRLYVGVKSGATEPSFLAGYPLDPSKAVEVKIGATVYNFFTNTSAHAEFAWPSPNNDAALIANMKSGTNMQVFGLSQRGTQTIDTFSLSGFTAAYNKAVEVCG